MKKLTSIFLLSSVVVKSSNFNSSYELVYIYGTFIGIVLLIVAIDRGVKYLYKKLKEQNDIFNEHTHANPFDE